MQEHTWQTFFKKYNSDAETARGYEKALTDFLNANDKHPSMESAIRPDEAMAFGVLLNYYRSKVRLIIETGTNKGISTALFALTLPQAEIITFDMPGLFGKYQHSMVNDTTWGMAFRDTVLAQRILTVDQNTYELDVAQYPRADLWFLDSGHDLKCVTHETALARENMREHGIIFYHDAKPNLPWGSDVWAFLNEHYPEAEFLDTSTGIAWVEY